MFPPPFRSLLPRPSSEDVARHAAAVALITALLRRDPSLRLGAKGSQAVKKHAFFGVVDWALLLSADTGVLCVRVRDLKNNTMQMLRSMIDDICEILLLI